MFTLLFAEECGYISINKLTIEYVCMYVVYGVHRHPQNHSLDVLEKSGPG